MNQNKTLLISGNQSGDLDSTVSALALAILIKNGQVFPWKGDVKALITGSKEDLILRPEIPALLEYIDYKEALYFTDKDRIGDALILVDHNSIDEPWKEQLPLVAIIDHHKKTFTDTAPQLMRIEHCGSCASLICDLCSNDFVFDRQTAVLLASAIQVDTGYFNPDWKKTEALDRSSYDRLKAYLLPQDIEFIESLSDIKNDLSHLSAYDLIRRDYKEITVNGFNIGLASIPFQGEYFTNLNNWKSSALQFSKERNLDGLLSLFTNVDPFQRQIGFFSGTGTHSPSVIEQIKESLIASSLGLSPSSLDMTENFSLFEQKDSTASRKKVLPLVSNTKLI